MSTEVEQPVDTELLTAFSTVMRGTVMTQALDTHLEGVQ